MTALQQALKISTTFPETVIHSVGHFLSVNRTCHISELFYARPVACCKHFCVPEFITKRHSVILLSTFLPGYAWRHVLLMNMPCLCLQIWWQWQPSTLGDIDSGVMRKVTLHRVDNCSFNLLCGLNFKWYTNYYPNFYYCNKNIRE
jgi:hypothetical protein